MCTKNLVIDFQAKAAEASSGDEQSKISELEHHKYITEIQVKGLKEALAAAHIELEEADIEKNKLGQQVSHLIM